MRVWVADSIQTSRLPRQRSSRCLVMRPLARVAPSGVRLQVAVLLGEHSSLIASSCHCAMAMSQQEGACGTLPSAAANDIEHNS